MLRLTEDQKARLRAAVRVARSHPELAGEIAAIYADFQRELDQRKPRCDQSGRCCRFEEYGHRLFVTTAELAAFVAGWRAKVASETPGRPENLDLETETTDLKTAIALPTFNPQAPVRAACPFQSDNLCTVHTIRPFGCRVFFCDPTATDWQHEQYERFHARLRALHDRLSIPYFYAEWIEAFSAIEADSRLCVIPSPLSARIGRE